MEKRLVCIIIFGFILSDLVAQTEVREKETEVKSSGDYYYGQMTAVDIEESKRMALDNLMYVIAEELVIQVSTLKVSVKGVEYISWSVGPRFKTVAFVRKDDVSSLFGLKEMHVVPIEYTEADVLAPDEIEKPDEVDSHTIPETIEVENPYEESELINELLNIQNLGSLEKWLGKKKYSSNVVAGGKSDFPESHSKCFILIFNTTNEQIVAVLEPGEGSRKDLLSGKTINSISTEYKNMGAIWIQII